MDQSSSELSLSIFTELRGACKQLKACVDVRTRQEKGSFSA